jgi:hypothetical protein
VSIAERLRSSSKEDDAPLVELTVVLFFLVDILGLILEPNTNGGRQLLWGKPQLSLTNNERELKLENQKPKCKAKRQTKASFSTVEFSKVDPLYTRRSVSFYREAGGLFTFREYPRVKRIKTECARLSSGDLQLGLHVIGAS